jgi:CubicO group peptidase (beta-lactamase class C family)/peptidoglycan/LPS O-acetylase OafA/YrhL
MSSRGPEAADRDGFLDSLKALALTRMVLWHTYAWPPLSYVIAAMPAMFFASGALSFRSLEHRRAGEFVIDRVRRLLLPLWVYTAVSYALMSALGYGPALRDLPAWLFPIWDPVGPLAAGALWIPLWYLRAYLWLVLLAPFAAASFRRAPRATLAAVGVAFLGVELWHARVGPVAFQLRDLAFYGLFFVGGFAYFSRGRIRAGVGLAAVLGGCVLAGAVVFVVAPPDRGIANASYVMHVFVGVFWLALLTAAARVLADPPRPLAAARALLCTRSLTIYLYHGPGLLLSDVLLRDQLELSGVPFLVLSGLVVIASCLAGVALFGWVEDIAAGRRRRAHTRISRPRAAGPRIAALVAGGTGIAIVALTFALPQPTSEAALDNELPPSGRAVIARAGEVEISSEPVPATVPQSSQPFTAAALDDVLDAWIEEQDDLTGRPTEELAVAMTRPGEPIVTAAWTSAGQAPELTAVPVRLASLTKTITASWVASGVVAGLVDLDAPVSTYVPEIARSDEFTLRQAMTHTSGLRNFELDPAETLEAWTNDPQFAHEPGTAFDYSDFNYYVAAMVMERMTATRWEDYVDDIAAATGVELHLDQEYMASPEPTLPWRADYFGAQWASGGVYATLADGARLYSSLLGDPEVLDPAARDLMTEFNPDETLFYYGLGLVPACPCWEEDGYLHAARYGLDSWGASYQFDEATGTVSMFVTNEWSMNAFSDIAFLSIHGALLDAVGARPLVAED